MQLIPAIDLHNSGCVRLHQGRFDEVTRYPADPCDLAKNYADDGAAWLHIVDLDGARSGSPEQLDIVARIAALPGVSVQCGGGIRSASAVTQVLEAGIERVVLGSVAVEAVDTVRSWMLLHGPERFVLALDVRLGDDGVPRVATRGWENQTELVLWDILDGYGTAARHVLCTDIGRDGAMTGPNLQLYARCVQRYPDIAFQASGGVRSTDDLKSLAEVPVASAIVGKALLERRFTLKETVPFLQSA